MNTTDEVFAFMALEGPQVHLWHPTESLSLRSWFVLGPSRRTGASHRTVTVRFSTTYMEVQCHSEQLLQLHLENYDLITNKDSPIQWQFIQKKAC